MDRVLYQAECGLRPKRRASWPEKSRAGRYGLWNRVTSPLPTGFPRIFDTQDGRSWHINKL